MVLYHRKHVWDFNPGMKGIHIPTSAQGRRLSKVSEDFLESTEATGWVRSVSKESFHRAVKRFERGSRLHELEEDIHVGYVVEIKKTGDLFGREGKVIEHQELDGHNDVMRVRVPGLPESDQIRSFTRQELLVLQKSTMPKLEESFEELYAIL